MIDTKFWLYFLTLIGLFSANQVAQAQTYIPSNRTPTSDNTLGTQVSGTGGNFDITGGVSKGQTLFHSFTDFSVPTSGQANFLNPVGNRDIITRVTGNLFSDINGLVNTNGANFLLINPSGIVFGPNAQLNVGKAFVGSTANSIDLVGGGRSITFGTNPSGDAPLLSVAPNVLFDVSRLNLDGGSGTISNFGTLETTNPNQYIGLIGGNITFNGGTITAPGAKVELGGLAQSGTIGFSLDNGILFPANVERGNVSLVSNATVPSLIDVEAGGGGSVTITAKDITFKGAATGIRAGIATGLGSPTAIAGDIKLNATGDVSFSDISFIRNRVNLGSQGKSGDIEIITRNLSVTSGAGVVGGTAGKGDAGNIKIAATGNVFFDGVQNSLPSVAFNLVDKGAEGKGGSVEIVSGNLSVTNGAQLAANTSGKGDAGNIKIIASGNVSFNNGAAFSTVEKGGNGKGGEIEIVTQNLSIASSAGLVTSTVGKGDAGNIKIIASDTISIDAVGSGLFSTIDREGEGKAGSIQIETQNLSVINGGQLAASTQGKGDAGNIKITATGNISFSNDGNALSTVEGGQGKGGEIEISTRNLAVTNGGQLLTITSGKGDAGNIKIKATGNVLFDGVRNGFRSAAESVVDTEGEGKAGNIQIETRNLSITNSARLAASSSGKGEAGNILLKSKTISLENGRIFSKSKSSSGGNINIFNADYLLMRNNSIIATDSDSIGKNGNGGNITINSPFIVAAPSNNDITANAYNGTGGRVEINSQGLFGIQYRPKGSPLTNDITASSTFGQNGNVNISTPGTDPGKDSTELPNATTDASTQISQVCSASNRQNKLTVTGRGGLPPNANDPLTSDVIWQDARAVNAPLIASNDPNPTKLAPPAVGWVFNGNGKVTLIAAKNQGQPTGTSVVCPTSSH
jgi:filamentous hemagglutinin family protein